MATWMTALGNMGSAITGTKDVYKPTDNITSTWGSLARNLLASAGVIGLDALAKKSGSNLQPTLQRSASGAPLPSIQAPGVLGKLGVGFTAGQGVQFGWLPVAIVGGLSVLVFIGFAGGYFRKR
jgi:hypothetical protein